jgi:hypothetical protein
LIDILGIIQVVSDAVTIGILQALEALALASFIGGTNYEATEDVMVVLWQIAKHKGNHHSDQVSHIPSV